MYSDNCAQIYGVCVCVCAWKSRQRLNSIILQQASQVPAMTRSFLVPTISVAFVVLGESTVSCDVVFKGSELGGTTLANVFLLI